MRQRNWIFYKVILYIGLAAAIALLSILSYLAFFKYPQHWHDITVPLILLGALIQIFFYLMCLRLVHYYIPNRFEPDKFFSIFYKLLLVINSCMAVGLLLLLAWGFLDTFLGRSRPAPEDYTAVFIIGSYTFLSIYISATSVVLLRYNRYQVSTDEEKWLSQLGNAQLNQ